ncbi:MAG: ribosome maturation factor RimM [Gammaproteobacteria bacterium]|jgi:16S rRNA processing protein RimM|nr:MAG: ribosome maturation factor RimM [Gammaproteobacteria bacterium]
MVVVGRIQGPYGIKGWVHVASFTDPKENIQSYSPWHLGSQSGEPDWQLAEIESVRPHKQGYVAKLSGIEDRNGAEAVKGRLIGVPEASLPEPESGEYYWRDLIDAEVVDAEGRILGTVASLIETGAHDVLVIKRLQPRDQAEEVLIPFHSSYVLDVDQAAKRIRVDWQAEETD